MQLNKVDNLNDAEKSTFSFLDTYTPETFTPKEKKVLLKFFTNWDKPVFAIHNLPQEVVGAMFSRYSRTAKSVRRLFLDEFLQPNETLAKTIGVNSDLAAANQRTQNFYKRVFAEYGDDSVIQMGSVHIAFEGVSQIAVKVIEDGRVASAYIEKSTRYVDFGSKVGGRYLYLEVPELMDSQYKKEFIDWNETAFRYYARSFPKFFKHFKKTYPLKDQTFINPATGGEVLYKDIKDAEEKEKAKKAYERALKARSFDSIRLFLPLTMVSNLGAHFSGQAAENAINKMLSSVHSEVREVGRLALSELLKVSPSFLQHVEHKYGEYQRKYRKEVANKMLETSTRYKINSKTDKKNNYPVLIDWDPDADVKLSAQILFTQNKDGVSKGAIVEWARKIKAKELKEIKKEKFSPTLINIITESLPDRKSSGYNRRHKLPRAFEHVYVEIEFYEDYGVYKDLQRNRISSTEKQTYLAAQVKIPKEFKDKNLSPVLERYKDLAQKTRNLQRKLFTSGIPQLTSASEYIMLHGNMVRFTVRANIRQWVFFTELRTIEGGHPSYRLAMQKAVRLILKKYPFMKNLFAHVNWKRDVGLGRLRAEIKTQEKLSKIIDTRI